MSRTSHKSCSTELLASFYPGFGESVALRWTTMINTLAIPFKWGSNMFVISEVTTN